MRWFKNVITLSFKELQSLLSDKVMLGIIVVIFSVAIIAISKGLSMDVKNATVAIVDEDHSALTTRLSDALLPPYFKPPVQFRTKAAAEAAMNEGQFIFLINFPPHLERDIERQRHPQIQVIADATAMSQAGVGFIYIERIFSQEVAQFFHQPTSESLLDFTPITNVWFNANTNSMWYLAVMNVATFVFLLAMLLVGAAVIRERERGTIEHLLVMPVSASEIAAAKIFTNSLAIAIAALLSLILVVHLFLGVPINGSIGLWFFGTLIFLFTAAGLGVLLATIAPTMPQFALLMLPLYIVLRLISGGETPLESMPLWLQQVTAFSPMTQYVVFTNDVLFRHATLFLVQSKLWEMAATGAVFIAIALYFFRSMLDKQG